MQASAWEIQFFVVRRRGGRSGFGVRSRAEQNRQRTIAPKFCECPWADQSRKVAAVNIAANHASIFLGASSIALQSFKAPRPSICSLNGSIESKEFAEWRDVINDEKREWTDRPNSQKSQTQKDGDLLHKSSMRKKPTGLIFFRSNRF
jgi:hypothetical protein